jgi:hypothetical protein
MKNVSAWLEYSFEWIAGGDWGACRGTHLYRKVQIIEDDGIRPSGISELDVL